MYVDVATTYIDVATMCCSRDVVTRPWTHAPLTLALVLLVISACCFLAQAAMFEQHSIMYVYNLTPRAFCAREALRLAILVYAIRFVLAVATTMRVLSLALLAAAAVEARGGLAPHRPSARLTLRPPQLCARHPPHVGSPLAAARGLSGALARFAFASRESLSPVLGPSFAARKSPPPNDYRSGCASHGQPLGPGSGPLFFVSISQNPRPPTLSILVLPGDPVADVASAPAWPPLPWRLHLGLLLAPTTQAFSLAASMVSFAC